MGDGGIVTAERWQQIKRILEKALEKEPGLRDAYVAAACAGDLDLREEVESLLAADDDSLDFIETPLVDLHASEPPIEPLALGERVGAWRIVREIGRGGMGSVYLAARADEAFEKQVAVKVIRRGMDTEDVIRRFRSERQILAKLDHPNIARLLDAGATEDGRPFFVMEAIDGRPIDEYCEAERLPLEARIELVLQIGSALQFAHQNLVVHRDLKPGNVLIAADGTPRLLDFGIAKLLDADASEAPVTRLGVRPMTPEYASPEQVRGERVTTASDVYALGVLLYTLLTGCSPYEPRPDDREALARAIEEEAPPKPSSVVLRPGERARRPPAGEPHALRKRLAGDLDNIVLKAMRKEPERRYPSVERLAGDLRRYLDGMPVEASGDTWGYRAGKFVRRHRLAVSAAALAVLLLVGFSVTATLLWQRAERQKERAEAEKERAELEKERAEREKERAEAVSNFLEEIFQNPDPSESRGEEVTARELLDNGAERIEQDLEGQPVVQAELMETMGRVYRKLGLYQPARELLQGALQLRRATFGERDLRVAASLQNTSILFHDMGDLETAEQLLYQSLEIRRERGQTKDPDYAAALTNLAALLEARGELKAAEALHRESLELKKRMLGEEHEDVARSLNNLGVNLHNQGDLKGAEVYLREALAKRQKLLGDDHPEVTSTQNNLAVLLEDLGKLGEAESLYRQVLTTRRNIYPNRHGKVAAALSNLAALLVDQGNGRAAEPLYREALSIADELLPPTNENRAVFLRGVAYSLLTQGQAAEAEPLAREALAIFREVESPKWRIADAESVLGGCLAAQGRFQEAEPLLLAGYEALRTEKGLGTRYLPPARERLAGLYEAWGKPERARAYQVSPVVPAGR
jgi:eukaryotic-like serine/threonine-protein kinase